MAEPRSRFVVQQHDATTMHWDFRLEVDGVLASWAVPKGPSTDPRDKRFATRTDDHSLSYIDYEGMIPEGEYGAGPVIVWDTGEYENRTTGDDGADMSMAEGLTAGHVSFRLHGEKLRGGWALTRFRGDDGWLLVKKDDDHADARRNPVSTETESVLSGRTVDDIGTEAADHEEAT